MEQHRNNHDAATKILPENCVAYLRSKGWNETGSFGRDAKVYGRADGGGRFHEFIVPMKKDVGGFGRVMLNLLTELQDIEGRHLIYIAEDMIGAKTSAEAAFVESEITALEYLLSMTPEAHVIDRLSLEARLAKAKEALADMRIGS